MNGPMTTRLIMGKSKPLGLRARAEENAQRGYLASELAVRYGYPSFPATAQPGTQWIAIIELGGGYSPADMAAYCAKVGCPVPPIREISIGGVKNAYTGDPNSADGEVALDMQVIAGATGGKVGLIMVWAPNSDAGFIAAIQAVAAEGSACALSISWGQAERGWQAQSVAKMDAAFQACAAKGISCFAASGDDGSADGGPGNNTDYPASSPYCIGCGGTTISGSAESAWSYGGGGVSRNYSKPSWQVGVGGNARLVPDVAADADSNSGYIVHINGKDYTFGGTSAVSPMWSALVALIVANTGKRLGFFLPDLYQHADLTDITSGSNGAFKATPGVDPCTGLGVPNAVFAKRMISTTPVPPPGPGPGPGNPPLPPVAKQHVLIFEGPYKIDGVNQT